MAMVCTQCNTLHDQSLQCPTCGRRLLYREQAARGGRARDGLRWQQTPWGRILIGLLLAQGLFYGLHRLLTGLLLALSADGSPSALGTVHGVALLQAAQLLTLLAGTLLAGAGQRQGALIGAVVGIWN